MSLGTIDASNLSRILAIFDAWFGTIPFFDPDSKKVCNPLCLNDLIILINILRNP